MRNDPSILYLPNRSESYPLADDRAQDLIAQLTALLGVPPFAWDNDGGIEIQCGMWRVWQQTDATSKELAELYLWAGARALLIAAKEECGHG